MLIDEAIMLFINKIKWILEKEFEFITFTHQNTKTYESVHQQLNQYLLPP